MGMARVLRVRFVTGSPRAPDTKKVPQPEVRLETGWSQGAGLHASSDRSRGRASTRAHGRTRDATAPRSNERVTWRPPPPTADGGAVCFGDRHARAITIESNVCERRLTAARNIEVTKARNQERISCLRVFVANSIGPESTGTFHWHRPDPSSNEAKPLAERVGFEPSRN